jgi:hypothetical protein
MQELDEQLKIKRALHLQNRENLIKEQVTNSSQNSLKKQLDEDEKELKETNAKLIIENAELEKDNNGLKNKISETI